MKKLLITRGIPDAVVDAARLRFDVTLRESTEGLMPDEAAQALEDYDAILPTLGDQFTADAFAGPIRTGVLGNFGVGYNHIDVAAATQVGIVVSNTPDVVTDATADIALTLILATCRRAGEGERLVRSGMWLGWTPTNARHPCDGQTGRDHRHGADRTSGCATLSLRVRHAGDLLQPFAKRGRGAIPPS